MASIADNDCDPRSSAILEGIAERITPQQFETWFRSLRLTYVPPDEVRIAVPNRFHRVWIERRYQDVIAETVRQLASAAPRITFSIDATLRTDLLPAGAQEEEVTPFPAPEDRAAESESLGQALNPDYTFENFVVGPSNHFCHAAARAVAERPGDTYNPVFLHGNSGLGKTHLLRRCATSCGGRNARSAISRVRTSRTILSARSRAGASIPSGGATAMWTCLR